MSPGDLQKNKASIGSDLLFEFNSATLRDDARITLLTVAQLIDRNPGMYCWVEGHTDLIGGEESNLRLSRRRGEAVKDWLVRSLQLEPKFIVVRACGMSQPVVSGGSKEEQAPNRRVDIKMRKNPPLETEVRILEKPARAIIVEEEEKPARAIIVEDEPKPARAIIVGDDEDEIPSAIPVPGNDIPSARRVRE
jgi:hypothetical protein